MRRRATVRRSGAFFAEPAEARRAAREGRARGGAGVVVGRRVGPRGRSGWRCWHLSFAIPRHSRHTSTPTCDICLVTLFAAMYALPTLYKARGLPLKRPVCAICIDRTKGRTEQIRLAYRVTVWLCPGHASHAFQTKRGGSDFVRTLMGVWQANGCMTQARHRALDAHLNQLRTPPPRHRPGSYAWPELDRKSVV